MLVPTIDIKLDGQNMNPMYEVLTVDVFSEVNRIPWAEICLLDGDAAARKFAISDSGDFDLGTPIKITLYYLEHKETQALVFDGIVTRQSIEIDGRGQLLRIEARHRAFQMTKVLKSATFPDEDDAGSIAKVVGNYPDLKLAWNGVSGPGKSKDLELIQFQSTDWDYVLSRCAANGWLIVPTTKGLQIFASPTAQGGVAQERILDFKKNEIYSLELAMDGTEQCEKTEALAWNSRTQALSAPSAANKIKLGPSKTNAGGIEKVSKSVANRLVSGTRMRDPELKAWANGNQIRARHAFLRGRFETNGNGKIQPGQTCRIEGIASKFDHKAFITGVRQRMGAHGWTTDVQIGLPAAHPLSPQHGFGQAPAAGLLPPVQGLQIGIVKNFKEDKDGGEYRVQLYLPAMDESSNLIWARMGMPSAGKGKEKSRGFQLFPEPGDEVVVGFINADPRSAIVLTSLFNGVNAPLYPPDDKNFKSAWATKSGSKIEFDDENQEIMIWTSKDLTWQMSEKQELITLTDTKGKASFKLGKGGIEMAVGDNKIKIDEQGITITGAKNVLDLQSSGVLVDSKGTLDLKGPNGVKVDGGPKVEIKGGMVELM